VTLTRTIGTEPWHLEANAAELIRYFARNGRRVLAAHAKAVVQTQAKKVVAKVTPKPKPKVAAHRIEARKLAVSNRGLELIASFEGFRSAPYRDAVGVWTIGYGHTHGVSAFTKPITREHALGLLHADAHAAEAAVRALGVPMTQGQFDATVSAVYNLGPGILAKGRTLGNALRARRYSAAANALLLYVFAGGHKLLGLVRRRAAERRMFLS
jgi:lysozyme